MLDRYVIYSVTYRYIYIQIDNGHFASQVNNAMKWRYSVGVCVVVVGCTYCYRAPQFRD